MTERDAHGISWTYDPRVALVTGASSGIGERTALRLQEAGFEVYAVARRVERMKALADAGVHVVRDGRHRRRLHDVRRRPGRRGAGPDRRPGQQRRLRVLRRGRGRADRRGATAVRGQRLRAGPTDPAASRPTCARSPASTSPSGRGSSTSPASAGSSTSRSAPGTTPRSSPSKASATACGSSWRRTGSTSIIIEPGPIRTEWNEISRDSLLEASSGGAYEEQAHRVHHVMARADRRVSSSGPDVVAKKVVAAVLANTPRARYPVGRGAGTIAAGPQAAARRGVRLRRQGDVRRPWPVRRRRPGHR